jgi:hypothetical protein
MVQAGLTEVGCGESVCKSWHRATESIPEGDPHQGDQDRREVRPEEERPVGNDQVNRGVVQVDQGGQAEGEPQIHQPMDDRG